MNHLRSATFGAFVVLLLMLSFNTSSIVSEASTQPPQRRGRVQRVKKHGPTRPRTDYSHFSHRTHVDKEKPACDGCHKFPTANWESVRTEDAAFPDVAEFPEHETCIDCHRQQFFARERPAPAICSNCHVKVTPRDTSRFLFPSLGDVSSKQPKRSIATEFEINFPRDKHDEDVRITPNSHTTCFSCHNVEAGLTPAPSDCHVCHRLAAPPASRSSRHHAAGRRVNVVQQQMNVRDDADYSKFQHASAYHARLPCLLCHRREGNATRPAMPGGKDHLPCAGCHAKQFADQSNAICTNCHSEPSTGALKAFPKLSSFNMTFDHARHTNVACANCHRPARKGVALTIPTGFNAHVTCFQCHGPQAKAGDRDISSCGTCHQPGPYKRTSQMARAFRVGFSHDRHNRGEGLSCNDCHRVRGGDVTAPQPLNHHARAGSFSCMNCHNGKRAFGGDDFTACKRCHTGQAWHF